MNNIKKKIFNYKGHLTTSSIWPLINSLTIFSMVTGFVMYMKFYQGGFLLFLYGFFFTILNTSLWWRDVVRESTFQGEHTILVQKNLRLGMILFIVSEVMFFFAFFWAFFHSAIHPTIELAFLWPPINILPFNYYQIPLVNTIILLVSGIAVTESHFCIKIGNRIRAIYFLIYTIFLAILFTLFQVYEYYEAQFSITDGIYGSTFFMLTGFHGFHVILGTIFLLVSLVRLVKGHFSSTHHFGLEAAVWYWHFVDVIWLFVYGIIYIWGYSN